MFEELVGFVRELYGVSNGSVSLHEPRFQGREREYVLEAIDSTFVSSVGPFVDRFEKDVARHAGCAFGVATVNGTAALHAGLIILGVKPGDLVVTQSLTFIATCNAISYIGATPAFVDVDELTLGMSPESLGNFLRNDCEKRADGTYHRASGKRVAACAPMHTFGLPARMLEITVVCETAGVPVLEDAAEALGSSRGGKACGSFGRMGAFSFNGNKIVTTGGGGALVTNDQNFAKRAKFLTTTAKTPHPYLFQHDEIGFNYRLPNLNAALGVAQLESLDQFLRQKRKIAERYREFFSGRRGVRFVVEPEGTTSNYWLNAIVLENAADRESFLRETNERGILTRPVWRLMHHTPMFAQAPRTDLSKSEWLEARVVNLPSSATDRVDA